MLEGSHGYTDDKLLGFDEGIQVWLYDGKVIGTILGNLDGITHGIDVGTYMGSLEGFFYYSNYGKIEGLFLWGSLVYNDG